MHPNHCYSPRKYRHPVTIWRINPQTGAREEQQYFSEDLPNPLKKIGWTVKVKSGKRQFKNT